MAMAIRRLGLGLMLLLSSWLVGATELVAVPALTQPVMDTAQMMSATQRETLNAHLLQYSQQTGSQIAVLTVPTIAPETPFAYATRVMESWQLGRKDVHDGVLLLLVRDERKTHLAVGRGLEGAIPDVYAKRILEDVLRPHLQAGNVDKGITAALTQVEKLIAGEQLPEPSMIDSVIEMDEGDWEDFITFLFMLPLVLSSFFKSVFGRVLGSLLTGGLISLVTLVLGWGYAVAILAGLLGAVFAFVLGSNAFISGGGSGGGRGGGGWHNTGGFGGDRSSGRSSGGGFRGGGGSFGGGGASGGW